jgi:phosphoserine phosphatase RsbU/P
MDIDPPAAPAASLIVVDPTGHRSRVEIKPLPFLIGRQPGSHLILRDNRASRTHSRIVAEGGTYIVEDCGSRHGTLVNGLAVRRHRLSNGDKIEFGVADSYQLIFAIDGTELRNLMDQFAARDQGAGAPGGNLAKLRAILDLARTLQASFSTDDVLQSVVDAALAITGAERGFLLLAAGESLEIKAARNRSGASLDASELRVPRKVIHRALQQRRDLLYMNFDSAAGDGAADRSAADLELRSVVCVPLVRIRAGQGDATNVMSTRDETVGVLYMDSRAGAADMAGGNRELLQTLAIEASTVLENARLLEEERLKQQIDEEMRLARSIQQSLLPRALPAVGWLRGYGSSVASHEVGGDYYDLIQVNEGCWSAVVADVSGKGVSSALLASLLQGALLTATSRPKVLVERIGRLNRFLNERTGGEKYATVFYALVETSGQVHYVNAAHCPPLLLRSNGQYRYLDATGMPVGLIDSAEYELAGVELGDGDKLILYTDGVTEAQNAAGEFFGKLRMRELVVAHAADSCERVHAALLESVAAFTGDTPQSDDLTLLVIEYRS